MIYKILNIFKGNKMIIDIFIKNVKENPNKIALIVDGKKLTYLELSRKTALKDRLLKILY